MPRTTPLLAAAAALAAAVSLVASPASLTLPKYERYVGIDAACAWPRLSVLPNGEISALIWPHPNHGFVQGAAECWNSTDDGRTWQRAGVPVPNAAGFNRMNTAAGVAADGTYVALVAGWPRPFLPPWKGTLADEANLGSVLKDLKTLPPVPAVSHDHGHTWVQFPELKVPRQSTGHSLTPFGRISALRDGTLGVMLYGDEVWFYVSRDGGKSWTVRGQVTHDQAHNETTWIELENGDLLAAARGAVNSCVDAFRSKDGGVTWQPEGPLSLNGEHPADLTRLPDGRILLSYGLREPGLWGVAVRFGDRDGRNWSSPTVLVDFEDSSDHPREADPRRDGGYPSTVVAADGTLVTAYYCRGVPAHYRYHMGVVRWLPSKP
ncbi:MAG: exo-alpha-sialidase [Verrucomicrobia bacterium]|nr:exo-alpha-sialidase [Verrucomicrobiota bacterium]